jgi:glycosyltransferase involved in cell wall biosynthesis
MQALHLKMAFNKAAQRNNLDSNMFFSYIIPTIGRRSVDIAVNSVLEQNFDRAKLEVIVVNDSGQSLPVADWHDAQCVRIINTHKSERSFARNSGAAVAQGTYLAFLDDDDWILPGALESFWQLANQYPNAAWLYGGIRIVDERDKELAEINSGLTGNCFSQIMGGAWAPIQASIIQARAFFESGGFDPQIGATQDEDLCRRIASRGDFANTPDVVACLYRGRTWSTSTPYQRAPEFTKYSRDLILSKPKTFQRLRSSVDSNYWSGRVLRVYLSTLVWNLKKKRFFTTLSRLLYSSAFLGLSIPHLFSHAYWAGLRADHVPESLHFVMQNKNRKSHVQKLNPKSHG